MRFVTDPLGNVTEYVYDARNRLVEIIQTDGPLPTASVSTTTEGGSASEVQQVRFTDQYQIFGGTFTLTVDGQTTAAIDWNATAAAVAAALEALSNVGAGDVAVTKVTDTSLSQIWRIGRGKGDKSNY